MLEPLSLVRSVGFAVLFAGVEYRYINRREASGKDGLDQLGERPAFWVITPYHAYFLLPVFILVALAPLVTAWAANTFLIALLEDVAYFTWRGKWVQSGEWTTLMFGSFRVSRVTIPTWWPLALAISVSLYLMPL